MKLKELLSVAPNNIRLVLEDKNTDEYTVYDGELGRFHSEYQNSIVSWVRPIENGLAVRVEL